MLPIHVINLARRPVRLAQIGDALDAMGLAWQRVEAIDARERDAASLSAEFGSGSQSRDFPATPGDMACSLTHQRLWSVIASSSAEAAIILEDDAQLSESFPQLLACDLVGFMLRNGMGALKLEYWPGPQKSRRFPLGEDHGTVIGDVRLYRMRSSFLGSCAYVLTAAAARSLVERFPYLEVPVDHFLFGREAGLGFDVLRPGFLNPAPILHDVERFGSDIREERKAAGLDGRKRSWRQRIADHRQSRRDEAEIRRGAAERVEMRFSG